MKLTFRKVDTAGNPLAGVAFSLIDAQSGTVIAHAVSNEKGEFEITGFTVGDWILREDEAPEGFNLMNDYSRTARSPTRHPALPQDRSP